MRIYYILESEVKTSESLKKSKEREWLDKWKTAGMTINDFFIRPNCF